MALNISLLLQTKFQLIATILKFFQILTESSKEEI